MTPSLWITRTTCSWTRISNKWEHQAGLRSRVIQAIKQSHRAASPWKVKDFQLSNYLSDLIKTKSCTWNTTSSTPWRNRFRNFWPRQNTLATWVSSCGKWRDILYTTMSSPAMSNKTSKPSWTIQIWWKKSAATVIFTCMAATKTRVSPQW